MRPLKAGLRLGDDASFQKELNRNLVRLAQEAGVKLSLDTNLVGEAIAVATRVLHGGSKEDRLQIALSAITDLAARRPVEQRFEEMKTDYLKRTIIPNLLHSLRSKGMSFEKALRSPLVRRLIEMSGAREPTLRKYWDRPPNKVLVNIESIGKARGRDSIFAEYDPKRETSFLAFWKRSLRNQMIDELRVRAKAVDSLSRALRIGPDSEHGDVSDERTPELSVDDSPALDTKLMVDQFRNRLNLRNPRYLELLRILKDHDFDISKPKDHASIQRKLRIKDRTELLKLRDAFLKDLRAVFMSLDADAPTAETLLRIASIKGSRHSFLLQEIHFLTRQILGR